MALQKKNKDTAVSVGLTPTQASSKPVKEVLDESTYTNSLEKIIVRDFYPDLPRLEAQEEYFDAFERNDTEKLRMIHKKYGPKDRTKTPNIYATPATFETPVEEPKQTPRLPPEKTNAPPGPSTSTGQSEEDQPTSNPEPHSDKKDKEDAATRVSLDQFLARHTSEDNASFESILQETERKRRLKLQWLYEKTKTQEEEKEKRLALPSIEQQALETGGSKVQTWTYTPNNSLMYVPEGSALSAKEKLEKVGKSRVIRHSNSRFVRDPFNLEKSKDTITQAASARAQNQHGRIGADGKEILPNGTPAVDGYGFVDTPTPAPGVDESPLMSWGEIEGTPFRLDGGDTPMLHRTPGPVFRIPDVPKRDRLALRLADDVGKAHRAKKKSALDAVKASLSSPAPFSSKSTRMGSLSRAAQRLASTKLRGKGHTDKALRESYTPSPSPSHRLPGDKTPVILTPGSARKTPKSGGTPVARETRSTPKRGNNAEITSLTDNLLNLPKRQKAQDYF